MICPNCGESKTHVRATRVLPGKTRRLRRCNVCGLCFHTQETCIAAAALAGDAPEPQAPGPMARGSAA